VDEKKRGAQKPDIARIEALRNLPKEVVEQLSKDEINAFLFDDLWPDSLRDKLKDFIE
jgi:hypothetical protein